MTKVMTGITNAGNRTKEISGQWLDNGSVVGIERLKHMGVVE